MLRRMTTTHRTVRGRSVPRFMYGTAWKEEQTEGLASEALAAGFEAVDTANQRRHYYEAGVGAALAAAGRARDELFLQTKFTHRAGQDHRLPYDPEASPADQVQQSFASSLEHLQTEYVDSYVLHGPQYRRGLSEVDWQVWVAMEAIYAAGQTRFLGVSNVSLEQLELLCSRAEVMPAFVQNRCYARTGWDREVRAFCQANDIVYQGFSLLTANGRELNSPPVQQIAERSGLTLAQVAFCFALQVGMLPLTGTSSPQHMREDLLCLERELEAADVAAIEAIAG